jgi:hypothetical protein
MRLLGKLPSNLELFKSEAQMTQIALAMSKMLEDVVAGEKTAEEALAFFEGIVPGAAELVKFTPEAGDGGGG